jgi:hypothetical protein
MRLILHAGTHKTGTTSIQKVLSANRSWLRRHGLIYPDGDGVYAKNKDGNSLKQHHPFARAFTGTSATRLALAVQFLDSARSQLERPRDLILISTENVYRHIEGGNELQHFAAADYWVRRAGYLKRLAEAFRGFDVAVLLFFRERESFARSLYAELAYRKEKPWQGSPREFMAQFCHWFEYEQQVATFKAVFSDVRTLSYEKATEQGLIRTFFRTIGFPMPPNADQIWTRKTTRLVKFRRFLDETVSARHRVPCL